MHSRSFLVCWRSGWSDINNDHVSSCFSFQTYIARASCHGVSVGSGQVQEASNRTLHLEAEVKREADFNASLEEIGSFKAKVWLKIEHVNTWYSCVAVIHNYCTLTYFALLANGFWMKFHFDGTSWCKSLKSTSWRSKQLPRARNGAGPGKLSPLQGLQFAGRADNKQTTIRQKQIQEI